MRITLCMGSSCFARGNGKNLELLRTWLSGRGIEAEVTLTGVLCENGCNGGPNVTIDGVTHPGVDAAGLLALLEDRLGGTPEGR